MRKLILCTTLILAACAGAPTADLSGPPVAQGEPNSQYSSAFAGQTRAPERVSEVRLNVETVASGLIHPWAMAFLPDGDILVTERPGRLRVVSRDGRISEPVEGLPLVVAQSPERPHDVAPRSAQRQAGLHDIALAPDFARTRMIYWSYAEPRGEDRNGTTVARGRLGADARRVEDVQIIFRQEPAWASLFHYGSQLEFDRAGRLYIALGERSLPEARVLSQDLSTLLGKVVRVNADGSVPPDNPFVGQTGARPEIWSYGIRNIQGAAFHPRTGELWTIEHGPRGGDEINIPRAGRNYGWPIITYGLEYRGPPTIGEGITAREGMEQPLYYWDPVIAPGDMLFYRGNLFPWRGDLVIAGLISQGLVRLELDGGRITGEERFGLGARARDVAEDADGALWVLTDEDSGSLLRITPQQ